jgi:SnoaL-like domain
MSLRLSEDLDVPTVITTYLAAKLGSEVDTILDCFTEDALVHDEGQDHRGRAAISAWLGELSSKYTLTYRVLGADRWPATVPATTTPTTTEPATAAALRVEVAGNFPGSPVVLHEHFSLAGDRITALTICP